ncbi:PAS domain-containing protein [Geobacter sp. AOG2]|uniref:PAS domain-containing protein n=1 Tax=Geobacter sp. AOG2 TaxID=1566347 RepID=UPI001CC7BF34|nr:PAS domain-containing protein [Geobacter sp. AOG2]GFE61969.1 hypothetical protein AOG2_25570 [Geobacter sp. AOG2]
METTNIMPANAPRETRRLALAFLIPLAAFALEWFFWKDLQPHAWFLFYPALFFSSWIGGLWGGLTATAFSTTAVWWFFIPPRYEFALDRPASAVSIGTFAVMGVVFSLTHERLRKANQRTATALAAVNAAREHLKEQVAARTDDLSRTVNALRESEATYRRTLDSMLEGCQIIGFDWRYRYINSTAEAHNRRPGAELLGRTVAECWPGITETLYFTVQKQCMEERTTHRLENEFTFPDGYTGWFRLIIQPATDGIAIYSEDITERKQAEEQLRTSAAEFRRISQEFNSLLDAIPDGLMLLDRELHILWGNRAATRDVGAAGEGQAGRRCYVLWDGRTEPCGSCPVPRCFESGSPEEAVIVNSDGRVWDIRTVPLTDEQGTVAKAIVLRRDITEQRKLETQYLHAQKMESIGTLAGGVAHDFNNILTAIIGYGQIALMGMEEDHPLRINFDGIMEAAERATHLTRELMLFSRKQESMRQPVDLNLIVGKMERFLHRIIGEDIILKQAAHATPLPILADSNQIEQVLMNLAVNARDAMPQGGEFVLRTDRVTLHDEFVSVHGFGKPGVYAHLAVSDTGQGMDAATLQRIFEPFYTTKKVGKGTGLGLAVVYGIVKQHEGFITASSEPGHGSTFSIYLPLTAAPQYETGAYQEEAPPPRGTETILLAEDDDLVRQLVTGVLTDAGYTVIAAADGEEAVHRFRDHADSIHLLLLDIIMPKMNGKETADAVHELCPGVKALYTSGYAADIVQQKVSPADIANLVHKPVSPPELLRRVRSALDGA